MTARRPLALLSLALLLPAANALVPGIVRDDDGEMDRIIVIDEIVDDNMAKALLLTEDDLARSETPALKIFGHALRCSGEHDWMLVVNGAPRIFFDPCERWSTSSFGYARFDVSTQDLVVGENWFYVAPFNSVQIAAVGADSDTDVGRSNLRQDGTSFPGESMTYLQFIAQDLDLPVSTAPRQLPELPERPDPREILRGNT